jgi:hypothetical protein
MKKKSRSTLVRVEPGDIVYMPKPPLAPGIEEKNGRTIIDPETVFVRCGSKVLSLGDLLDIPRRQAK